MDFDFVLRLGMSWCAGVVAVDFGLMKVRVGLFTLSALSFW